MICVKEQFQNDDDIEILDYEQNFKSLTIIIKNSANGIISQQKIEYFKKIKKDISVTVGNKNQSDIYINDCFGTFRFTLLFQNDNLILKDSINQRLTMLLQKGQIIQLNKLYLLDNYYVHLDEYNKILKLSNDIHQKSIFLMIQLNCFGDEIVVNNKILGSYQYSKNGQYMFYNNSDYTLINIFQNDIFILWQNQSVFIDQYKLKIQWKCQ